MSTLPKRGDVIEIRKEAGPAVHPMLARVVRVSDRTCWQGWAELEVAEIVDRYRASSAPRLAYVCLDGIRVVRTAETSRQTRQRVLASLNGGHFTPPRPRTSPETTGRTR